MRNGLRSKLIDGLLSFLIIMAMMWPLILMFRLLPRWGTSSYWVAVVVISSIAIWMLYRSTLEKNSEVARAWYGIFGGLCGWTVAELSHELGMIDIEQSDILIMLALFSAALLVLWKYFPATARFWIVIFMMNWVGHIFIHVAQEYLVGALLDMINRIVALAFGLLIFVLLYWIFFRTTTRLGRLWAGVSLWWSVSMIYFLILY
ncbi:MAG: hypothetical protein IMY76_09530 [Chloroflexi bacterium]|nr:hypothetical protein [Chloroflexota bacterium]